MIFGLDISKYNSGVDLARVRAEGLEFCVARVSTARLVGDVVREPELDPWWPRFRDEARRLGFVLSAYHRVGAGQSADEQAQMCVQHMGDRSIPLMLDHEGGAGGIDVFRAVWDAFRRRGVHVYAAYLPDWYWERIDKPDLRDLPPLVRSEYPYRETDSPQAIYQYVRPEHWEGYGGNHVEVLQFASSARVGGYAPLCVDAYRGSRMEYEQLLGIGPGVVSPSLTSEDAVALERFPATQVPPAPAGGGRWEDTDPRTWPASKEEYLPLAPPAAGNWRGLGSISSVTCGWPKGYVHYLRVFHDRDGSQEGTPLVTDLVREPGLELTAHWKLRRMELPAWSFWLLIKYVAPGGLGITVEYQH
jgi:hypothetical protein